MKLCRFNPDPDHSLYYEYQGVMAITMKPRQLNGNTYYPVERFVWFDIKNISFKNNWLYGDVDEIIQYFICLYENIENVSINNNILKIDVYEQDYYKYLIDFKV